MTLETYAEEWLATRRVRGRPLAPRTLDLYHWLLTRHLVPQLGQRELATLTPVDVRRWHAALSGPGGPGPSTAAKAYRLLRAMTTTAVADGILQTSPCTVRGGGQESADERPALAVEDVLRLADAAGDRWRALVLTAAWTGLRFGELAALRRPAVDLPARSLHVRASAGWLADGRRVEGPPKSRAGRRTVALPEVLVPELRRHLDRYAEPDPEGLVFIGERGAPLRTSGFSTRVWRPAVTRAGLPGVHFHDLRHVAGTLAAQSGATVRELMSRLGHASPDASLRYLHATAARDHAIAEAVSRTVRQAVSPGSTAT